MITLPRKDPTIIIIWIKLNVCVLIHYILGFENFYLHCVYLIRSVDNFNHSSVYNDYFPVC